MARLGLPRAYFDEIERQLDHLPDGVVGPPPEPSTLRMTRVERAHRRAAHNCFQAFAVAAAASTKGPWWIEIEPDVRLPGDLLGVPDVAGWRFPAGEVLPPGGAGALPPTVCSKVISAEFAKSYRVARLPFYARAGVLWFWLIDPAARSVEVLENAGGELIAVREGKGSDEIVLPPFDKPIRLASWWLK